MRRILKPTGSIYLHCDPTASHYLKLLMDEVFGKKNFRNEVAWCYEGRELRKTSYNPKHDIILFYARSRKIVFNWEAVAEPMKQSSVDALSRFADEDGRKYVLRYKRGGGLTPKHKEGDADVYRQYVPEKYPPRDWVQIDVARKKERTDYPTQKPRGRPETRKIEQINTTPEEFARAMFRNANRELQVLKKIKFEK